MPRPPRATPSLDTAVDDMLRGRTPARAEFVCPDCAGPARASASPRGDQLSVSARCPCTLLEYDGVPKFPGWEQLLAPPPPDFNPDPLSLRQQGRPGGHNPFAGDTRPTSRQVPCPYCDAPVGDKAKQCFVCGHDWRDPDHVVCRKGPDRLPPGLKWKSDHVLQLCQDPSGNRYTKYREAGAAADPHRVFETPPRPAWQWASGYFPGRLGSVTTTGEKFALDAHGCWLTWTEVQWLHRAHRGEIRPDQIPWSTPASPKRG